MFMWNQHYILVLQKFEILFSFLVRATGASSVLVRHAQYSTEGKTQKVYPPNLPGYKYVNAEDPDMSMKEMSNRAAQTMFWTELARGFAVTLAHIFKVFITKNLQKRGCF